ncbi:MAG: DinB family protein [Maritimibacter sp.]
MITVEFAQAMARYNRWQNRSIYDAADGLSDEERRRDRGAFFGSIHATLSHVYWGDCLWMARFDGWEAPAGGLADSSEFVADWEALKALRYAADEKIVDWAGRLAPGDLSGDLNWYSMAMQADVSKPLGLCIAHVFNHQTHHRGQVHAMLTAAGAKPDDTDLAFMDTSIGG